MCHLTWIRVGSDRDNALDVHYRPGSTRTSTYDIAMDGVWYTQINRNRSSLEWQDIGHAPPEIKHNRFNQSHINRRIFFSVGNVFGNFHSLEYTTCMLSCEVCINLGCRWIKKISSVNKRFILYVDHVPQARWNLSLHDFTPDKCMGLGIHSIFNQQLGCIDNGQRKYIGRPRKPQSHKLI